MSNEIQLQPEQLYFLGKVMQAQYIDYAYVAAMHEIGRSYEQIRQRCLTDLTRMHLIRRRISGGVTVSPETEALLRPVFFGRLETCLEVADPRAGTLESCNFHYLDGSMTMVEKRSGSLVLSAGENPQLLERIRSAVGSHWGRPRPLAALNKEAVTRVIRARRGKVQQGCRALVLAEQAGGWYIESNNRPTGCDDNQVIQQLWELLKGE